MDGHRGLAGNCKLLKELSNGGKLHDVIKKVKDESNQYWLGIRNNKVMLYYMGGKILNISASGLLSFNPKYIKHYDKNLQFGEGRFKSISEWNDKENLLRAAIADFQKTKSEKIAQQEIMIENNKSDISKWYAVDMEYVSKHGRFDIIALSKNRGENGKYKIALIELKSDMEAFSGTKAERKDGKITKIKNYGSGIAGHVNSFYEFRRGENLERLAKEIVTILSNYRDLGLLSGFEDLTTETDIDTQPESVECIIMCTDIEDKKYAISQVRKYIFYERGISSEVCLEELWGTDFDEKFAELNLKILVVNKERIIDESNFEMIKK